MIFKSTPFLKILFPFVIGILFVFNYGILNHAHLLFLIASLAVISTFLFQKLNQSHTYLKKWIYIFCLNVFLFLLAHEACFLYQAKNTTNHYSHYVQSQPQGFIAVIKDVPVVTSKFTKLFVDINYIERNDTWHQVDGHIILYLKSTQPKSLEIGRTIFVRSKFSYPNEPMNPNEFNYKSYLENKNIFHVVYVKANECGISPSIDNPFSITLIGSKIKAKVIGILRRSGLSQQAFAICSALLIGYDDEIDSDTIQSFSHSGTLHILSVSGMHTGVLYGILLFLFSLVDKYNQYPKLKCMVILLSLAFFVLVTGLSPSVLRATIMLSLITIGKTFYKQGNSYNTLLFSAFVILLFNPYLIQDAGFLLSYFAVLGIIVLVPIFNHRFVFKYKILQWLWSCVLISIAATLFTLPISLYYFHQFPIWFVFSNLLIIPISTCILLASAILVCLYKVVFIKQLLVSLIQGLNSMMLWIAKLTDDPNFGYVDYIPFSKTDVLICFVLITAFVFILNTKQFKFVVCFMATIILWLCISLYTNFTQLNQTELVAFHIKQKSATLIRAGNVGYLISDSITKSEFDRSIKPYLFNFSHFKLIPYKNLEYVNPNYILVSHNKLPLFQNYLQFKPLVIADCSNNPTFVKHLKKECQINGFRFYSVKEKGALQVALNQ